MPETNQCRYFTCSVSCMQIYTLVQFMCNSMRHTCVFKTFSLNYSSVLVIVVGKAELLEHDENWNALIEGCKLHNTFHTPQMTSYNWRNVYFLPLLNVNFKLKIRFSIIYIPKEEKKNKRKTPCYLYIKHLKWSEQTYWVYVKKSSLEMRNLNFQIRLALLIASKSVCYFFHA